MIARGADLNVLKVLPVSDLMHTNTQRSMCATFMTRARDVNQAPRGTTHAARACALSKR